MHCMVAAALVHRRARATRYRPKARHTQREVMWNTCYAVDAAHSEGALAVGLGTYAESQCVPAFAVESSECEIRGPTAKVSCNTLRSRRTGSPMPDVSTINASPNDVAASDHHPSSPEFGGGGEFGGAGGDHSW